MCNEVAPYLIENTETGRCRYHPLKPHKQHLMVNPFSSQRVISLLQRHKLVQRHPSLPLVIHDMGDQSRSSRMRALYDSALHDYEKLLGVILPNHIVAEQLQNCNSAESVTALILKQARAFTPGVHGRLTKSLEDAIAVLYALSSNTALGEAVDIPFPPDRAIFTALAVLLVEVKDVSDSHDPLVDLLESIKDCLNRLNIYGKLSPMGAMTEVIVKIMVELLSTLALATKHAKLKQPMKFVKKVLGEKTMEAVLQRLDRLTLDEARQTATHTLEVVYGLVQNMRVVMDDGNASVDNVNEALRMVQRIASDINKSKREKMEQDIRSWLSPPDPWKNHHIALESRHTGTAMWFIEGDAFLEWKTSGPSSLLWIHGKPGSGKSVLSSTIIEHIDKMQDSGLASLVFFYCDFREDQKKDRRGLLSSALVQLCYQFDPYCDLLSKFYSEHARGSQYPSDDALSRCFKKILELPRQPPIYLIVDALDECSKTSAMPSPREKVLMLVKELIDSQLPKLRICVTSRPEMDIKSAFDPLAFRSISLHDETGQMEDIEKFIKSTVTTDSMMRHWKAEDKQLVIDILTQRANGMFRWVYCQISYLRGCLPRRIRHALNELPETLDETYQRTLREINQANWELAHTLFQCLAVASCPLYVEQLAEFLAFDFEAGPIPKFREDWRLEDPLDAVLSTCSTLLAIVYVEGSQVIQFSHYSVKEFLMSSRLADECDVISRRYHISMIPAHTLVARACLGILLHLDESVTSDSLPTFPLIKYAAKHWVDHARFDDVGKSVEDGMKRLFDPNKQHLATWVWISDPERPLTHQSIESTKPSVPKGTPLHYAALCGLRTMVEFLVTEHPQSVHSRDLEGSTPLHYAARRGRVEIVRFLLERGGDPKAQDDQGETPLKRTWSSEVARVLIEYGADAAAQSPSGYSELHSVVMAKGPESVEVASILLDHGADPMARTEDGATPLHLACTKGLAQLLIEHGADVAAQNKTGQTPLHRASWWDIALVLLDSGADVTAQDKDGSTPLHEASREYFKEDIVLTLLENGADARAKDWDGLTPLHRAPNGQIVHTLLEHGADAAARDKDGLTPLHWASHLKYSEAVIALLEHGADVNARDKDGMTPLHWASSQGDWLESYSSIPHQNGLTEDLRAIDEDQEIVQLEASSEEITRVPLGYGANSTVQIDRGSTRLHVASQEGQVEEVENYGADMATLGEEWRTRLYWTKSETVARMLTSRSEIAVRVLMSHRKLAGAQLGKDWWTRLYSASSEKVVRVLIEHGAEVTAQDQDGSTPLHVTSFTDAARVLIEEGADLAAENQSGSSPLHLASQRGYVGVATVLLEYGADTAARDQDGRTPLFLASSRGVAALLIDYGADETARDKNGSTPLHETPFADVALFLLDNYADLNARDRNGSTPLHRASSKGCIEVAKALLDYGADPTAQTEDGWTPLHLASSGGYMELVNILLERGADARFQAQDGWTPIDMA